MRGDKARFRLCTCMGTVVLSVILLWAVAGATCRRGLLFGPATRTLRENKIKFAFEQLTGLALPSDTKSMRAIQYDFRGREMYVAIHTTPKGCSEILETFSGPDVEQDVIRPGRRLPVSWRVTAFSKGYDHQQKLGENLFERALLQPFFEWREPRDLGTVHYRKYGDSPVYWTVLAFEDLGIVYIAAARIHPNAP